MGGTITVYEGIGPVRYQVRVGTKALDMTEDELIEFLCRPPVTEMES